MQKFRKKKITILNGRKIEEMNEIIICKNKSVIVAADVAEFCDLISLILAVKGVSGIGAFKLGFGLGLDGLKGMTEEIKKVLGKDFPVIYDHQKAANDIPDTGALFAKKLKEAGVDAAILFPFTGPVTQEAWTKSCQDAGLEVLTGGIMTHKKFLVSEGGYIADEAPEKIYRLACKLGVKHFAVPGNKLNWVQKIKEILTEELGEGNFVLYAPGFITQGGDISECGQVAGDKWHAIVGSAICGKINSDGAREAAINVTKMIA